MDKTEFMALAASKWEAITAHKKGSANFYDYEKGFDEIWVDFGRESLEGSLGKVSKDRRKKNEFKSLRSDTNR